MANGQNYNSFLATIGAMGAGIPNPGTPQNLLTNVESFGTALTNTFNTQSGVDAALVSQNSKDVFGSVMPFIKSTSKNLTDIGKQFASASQTAASNLGKGKK